MISAYWGEEMPPKVDISVSSVCLTFVCVKSLVHSADQPKVAAITNEGYGRLATLEVFVSTPCILVLTI